MTSSERQRRYLAKLAASKPVPPQADGGLVLRLDHIRLDPISTGLFVCRRLDRDVVLAFYNAIGRSLMEDSINPRNS